MDRYGRTTAILDIGELSQGMGLSALLLLISSIGIGRGRGRGRVYRLVGSPDSCLIRPTALVSPWRLGLFTIAHITAPVPRSPSLPPHLFPNVMLSTFLCIAVTCVGAANASLSLDGGWRKLQAHGHGVADVNICSDPNASPLTKRVGTLHDDQTDEQVDCTQGGCGGADTGHNGCERLSPRTATPTFLVITMFLLVTDSDNLDCSKTITAPQGNIVALVFTHFNLEQCGGACGPNRIWFIYHIRFMLFIYLYGLFIKFEYVDQFEYIWDQDCHPDFSGCTCAEVTSCDYVEVFDGPTSSSPSLGQFSGANLPSNLRSTSNSVTVHFHTDTGNAALTPGATEDPGFYLDWHFIEVLNNQVSFPHNSAQVVPAATAQK
eukprot:SAG31_NODE_2357_length_5874_cov_4.759827_7_plen_377_part_00